MRTVLVVEDSEQVRLRLRALIAEIPGLESLGECETAQDAIAWLDRATPDIVILDHALKASSGMRVLAEIRRRACTSVVIMFSQYDDEVYREMFLDAGADYFMSKTREAKALRDTLWRLARQPNSG